MSSLSSLAQYFSSIQQSVVRNAVQTQVAAKVQDTQKQTGEAMVELVRQAGKTLDTGKQFDAFA